MIYHLDVCESHGTHTVVSGWAFCPVDGWDARLTVARVLRATATTVYMATGGCVPRPDIAAHYAGQLRVARGAGSRARGSRAKSSTIPLPAGRP